MMMMSSGYSGPAPWHMTIDKATGGAVGDGGDAGFLEMFGDLHSSGGSDDLFELVWPQGGGSAGRSCTTETLQQAAGSSYTSSSLPPADRQPPSENEMAAWLYAVVRGAAEDDQLVPTAMEATKTEVKCTEVTVGNCNERGKQGRKSRHSEVHNLTEKRRRRKINEKFKTLQHLVPACDNKSNQTSTLDQTIKYMKSLQHQMQAMSSGCIIKPAASAAVYPVVQLVPYHLPPPPATVAGAVPLPPPAAFAPAILVRGHVAWPILPFAATLPLLPRSPHSAVVMGSWRTRWVPMEQHAGSAAAPVEVQNYQSAGSIDQVGARGAGLSANVA